MKPRDYTPLMAELEKAYEEHSPKCAELGRKANRYMVDGVSHTMRCSVLPGAKRRPRSILLSRARSWGSSSHGRGGSGRGGSPFPECAVTR